MSSVSPGSGLDQLMMRVQIIREAGGQPVQQVAALTICWKHMKQVEAAAGWSSDKQLQEQVQDQLLGTRILPAGKKRDDNDRVNQSVHMLTADPESAEVLWDRVLWPRAFLL